MFFFTSKHLGRFKMIKVNDLVISNLDSVDSELDQQELQQIRGGFVPGVGLIPATAGAFAVTAGIAINNARSGFQRPAGDVIGEQLSFAAPLLATAGLPK
jgi:lactobin A/cerein 7B family class IIb bacteriocin